MEEICETKQMDGPNIFTSSFPTVNKKIKNKRPTFVAFRLNTRQQLCAMQVKEHRHVA